MRLRTLLENTRSDEFTRIYNRLGGIVADGEPPIVHEQYGEEIQFDTLRAGTTVYHGTGEQFDERVEDLETPGWVSDSIDVAREFTSWNGGSDTRIIQYQTTSDMTLLLINGRDDLFDLEDQYGIEIDSPREMAEQICQQFHSDGWIIPNNYNSGADIMICNSRPLKYMGTEKIS